MVAQITLHTNFNPYPPVTSGKVSVQLSVFVPTHLMHTMRPMRLMRLMQVYLVVATWRMLQPGGRWHTLLAFQPQQRTDYLEVLTIE